MYSVQTVTVFHILTLCHSNVDNNLDDQMSDDQIEISGDERQKVGGYSSSGDEDSMDEDLKDLLDDQTISLEARKTIDPTNSLRSPQLSRLLQGHASDPPTLSPSPSSALDPPIIPTDTRTNMESLFTVNAPMTRAG
jgi:hypothetical protein